MDTRDIEDNHLPKLIYKPEQDDEMKVYKEAWDIVLKSWSGLEEYPYFPPPWNVSEFPEKTKGWIEFQKAIRKDSAYYLGKYK